MEPVVGIPIEVQKVTDRINALLKELAETYSGRIPVIEFFYDEQGQLVLETDRLDEE